MGHTIKEGNFFQRESHFYMPTSHQGKADSIFLARTDDSQRILIFPRTDLNGLYRV